MNILSRCFSWIHCVKSQKNPVTPVKNSEKILEVNHAHSISMVENHCWPAAGSNSISTVMR